MKKTVLMTLILSALIITAPSILAKGQAKKAKEVAVVPVPRLNNDGPFVVFSGDAVFIKNKTRKVANDAHYVESDLTPALKKFRDDFLQVKSASQLDIFFANTERDFDKYSNDVKVVALNLLMLKPFRGIEFRSRNILREKYSLNNKLNLIVGHALRNAEMFYDVNQGKVFQEYFTSVPVNSQLVGITTISGFQNFLYQEVFPVLNDTIKKISLIENKMGENDYFVFDNKILYGEGSFKDDILRYRAFGKAELSYMMTTIYATLHETSFLCAYNFDELQKVDQLIKEDEIFKKIIGFSFLNIAKERMKKIKKFSNFMTFREENFSKKVIADSYVYFKQAVNSANKTWNLIQERDFNPNFIINDSIMKSNANKTSHMLSNLTDLANSKDFHPVKSQITGDVVFVNLNNFFNNPPRDLKEFFPGSFNGNYGKASKYKLEAFASYFHSNESSLESIEKVFKVLSQANGGRKIVSSFLFL